MSQENVEVALEAIEAWNSGDMERLGELYDAGAVMLYEPSANWPEPGPFVGRDAIMRQFRWLRDTFESDSLEIVADPLAAGDQVVVHAIWRGGGRGPQADLEMAWVYTLRGALIVEAKFFTDHAEALEAAGLSE
jgi:ketosteroid isomerase-like protein